MKTTGRVWRFGDDVDTDVITPGRYNLTLDADDLREALFAEVRPDLAQECEPGDVIVAGTNFGCGSSRESAVWAPKHHGLGVLAESFARIFERNAVNVGLPHLAGDTSPLADGDTVTVDWAEAVVVDETTGDVLAFETPDPFVQQIIRAGGIKDYLQERGGLG